MSASVDAIRTPTSPCHRRDVHIDIPDTGQTGSPPRVDNPIPSHKVAQRDAAVQEIGVAVKVSPAVWYTAHQVCDEVTVPFLLCLGVCYSCSDGRNGIFGGDTAYHAEV